jgi:hypothetical protein
VFASTFTQDIEIARPKEISCKCKRFTSLEKAEDVNLGAPSRHRYSVPANSFLGAFSAVRLLRCALPLSGHLYDRPGDLYETVRYLYDHIESIGSLSLASSALCGDERKYAAWNESLLLEEQN